MPLIPLHVQGRDAPPDQGSPQPADDRTDNGPFGGTGQRCGKRTGHEHEPHARHDKIGRADGQAAQEACHRTDLGARLGDITGRHDAGRYLGRLEASADDRDVAHVESVVVKPAQRAFQRLAVGMILLRGAKVRPIEPLRSE